MKYTNSRIFLSLVSIFSFVNQQSGAADFSRAQQTFVPPSYIRRDLDALGTNDWSFPGLDSSSANSSSPDFGVGTLINRSGAPNLGTVSNIQKQASFLFNSGQLADAESLDRSGLKAFPNSAVLKAQFASITAAEAQQFLQGQNYDLAGKKARESLVADPNNKIAKAVDNAVLQAQGLDPNTVDGHVAVGDSLTTDGRLLEASVEYKLALQIKPNALAHVGLGNIALGKGQTADASRHFEKALNLDSNCALAYRQRGALRYILKDAVGANADFSKAVALNPSDQLAAEALTGLWKQQVSAYPGSANSHLGLARAYMQTQNLDAARNEYKTVVAIDPNNPTLPAARASFKLALAKQEAGQSVQAARTLDSQGAWNDAHQKVNEAIAYCPNDPQILLYNGQLCERLGLVPEAHDSYMNVLKVDPKNVQAAARLKALGFSSTTSAPTGLAATMMQPLNNWPPVAPLRGALPAANGSLPNANPSPANWPNSNVPVNFDNSANNAMPSNNIPSPINNINSPPNLQDSPQNMPLKAPMTPKTQSYLPVGNAYYDATQNRYIGDPAQVVMLGNFGSCVRALIMAEKQMLGAKNNNYSSATVDSDNLSDLHSDF